MFCDRKKLEKSKLDTVEKREKKIRTIIETTKMVRLSFLLCLLMDIFVSYSVYLYEPNFFLNNEQGLLARIFIYGYLHNDMFIMVSLVVVNIMIACLFYFIIYWYIMNKMIPKLDATIEWGKKEKKMRIAILIWVSTILLSGYLHFVGAISWLV